MQTSDDFCSDIRVDEVFRELEMFSKDIQFLVSADETDKGNCSLRNVIEIGNRESSGKQGRLETFFLDEL
jgi:hypothetical protein